jgi:hypothetical protein
MCEVEEDALVGGEEPVLGLVERPAAPAAAHANHAPTGAAAVCLLALKFPAEGAA